MRRVGHHLELNRSESKQQDELMDELRRRNKKAIKKLEIEINEMQERHEKEYKSLFDELVRYYRAKPGTKYDARKRKGKK